MSRINGRPVGPTYPTNPERFQATGSSETLSFVKNPLAGIFPNPGQDQVRDLSASGQALPFVALDEEPSHPESHTVNAGDSLSKIAKKYFGNPNLYMEIFNANRDQLKHPNALRQGMVLKLPQELFGKTDPTEATSRPESGILRNYRSENPLSYVTLHSELAPTVEEPAQHLHASDATRVEQPLAQIRAFTADDNDFNQVALQDLTSGRDSSRENSILHEDAVKVDKNFDAQSGMTLGNLSTTYDDWLHTTAGILTEHNASIKLPNNHGEPVSVDAAQLERLAAKPFNEVKAYFRDELGIAFVNTLWAMDDVLVDMQHDPYYQALKSVPKTVDLSAVADKFNLDSDKLNYLAQTHAHKHKQVPVELHGAPEKIRSQFSSKSADQILEGLSAHFDAKGRLTDPNDFETDVYALLEDASARRQLIQEFSLGSEDNLNAWAPAITAEGGMAESQRDYNSYFSVAAVMLNRVMGRNIRKAASHLAKGNSMETFKPIGMEQIIKEQGQFEIAWRAAPGTGGKNIYDYNKGLNTAFIKGRLNEGGNSQESFERAYEVTKDLLSGMSHMQADVNGVPQKNTGRSISDLFYFNQSRSRDYASSEDSAVAYIDDNNTHVFFKEWGDISFFR